MLNVNESSQNVFNKTKDYAWNPSLCADEWDKDCEIDEYLKNYACWKNVIDDFVIACGKIVDTSNTVNKFLW